MSILEKFGRCIYVHTDCEDGCKDHLIAKLEADKVELLEALKELSGYNEDCLLDCNMQCYRHKYKRLIQKMEK